MSGEIFQPMENPDEPNLPATRNPLLCYLCNEPYEEPCIFGCFHSFCNRCLRGRASEAKMSCPICGFVHTLKEGTSMPPQDLLLKFMVETSTEEKAQCANCDMPAPDSQMFFCNTCMQPLCAKCREETHRAKMFASHDMVLLTKRAREVHKKCALHEEPYIMFSSEKKIMLCINCFRDMRIESRGHCLDLETAYKQSCKKLDLRVQAFRELQNSVRDGILLFKALCEEIKSNADKERQSIEELHASLVERLAETKGILLQKVDSQYTEKDATFGSQLKSLSALLPTLHVHLVIASAFSGSANKFEFLDLAYVLMERLKLLVQKQHPLHPTQSGQIDTAYKTEFLKSLEPLLYVPVQRNALTTTAAVSSVNSSTGSSCPGSPVTHRLTPNHTRRANGLNGAKVKFIDAKGQFAEHCREFENAHRELLQRFEQMKGQCQELQRDLTMRRCLAKKEEVLKLGSSVEEVQNNLDTHYNTLEQKLPLLEKHWEESLERLNNEQDLYQAQLQDVMRLKQESQHLRVIASQLTSFVSSIAAVTERLAPKLGQSNQTSEQEIQMASLLEEINAVQPDSQQRVDAIRGAEEERQTNIANRTNPLDDELIKTKGLLRNPSLRDKKGDRRKRMEKDNASKLEASTQNGTDTTLKTPSTSTAASTTSSSSPASSKIMDVIVDQETPAGDACTQGKNTPEKDCTESSAVNSNSKTDTVLIDQALVCSSCDRNSQGSMTIKRCAIKSNDHNGNSEIEEYVSLALGGKKTLSTCGNQEGASSTSPNDCPNPLSPKAPKTFHEHKKQIEERRNRGSRDGCLSWREERGSSEVDPEAIRNLLKDVENFNRKESLTSPKKVSNGDAL